jgi:hypothetical protein
MDNAIFIGSSSSAVVHDGGQYQCAVEVSVLTGWEECDDDAMREQPWSHLQSVILGGLSGLA